MEQNDPALVEKYNRLVCLNYDHGIQLLISAMLQHVSRPMNVPKLDEEYDGCTTPSRCTY